jgi:hypothetical protein
MFKDYRNPVYLKDKNMLDVEVHHVVYGWIPTSINLAEVEPEQQFIVDQVDLNSIPVVETSRTVSSEKGEKALYIHHLRDVALAGEGATVITQDGRKWQANAKAVESVNKTLSTCTALGYVPEGTQWRDFYNVSHPATMELLKELAALFIMRETDIYKKSWAHVDAIRACNTLEELDALILPSAL